LLNEIADLISAAAFYSTSIDSNHSETGQFFSNFLLDKILPRTFKSHV